MSNENSIPSDNRNDPNNNQLPARRTPKLPPFNNVLDDEPSRLVFCIADNIEITVSVVERSS